MSRNWQKIKDLFAEAIELPADLRYGFLTERCDGDVGLFREVSSLIAASSEPDNLIERNAIDLASKLGVEKPEYSERQFGNYRIIREIGSGGMGTVFLAERSDGEFSMQVALKIVRNSIAGRDVIERFKRERQILAGLSHPNIAVLHDGGVSEKGEPFLAMEYIEGDSLLDHAERNDLELEKKLELFLKICSAVSYAHRNLVIHRDIKPSNILVSSDGEPKLLDFGVAKAFESNNAVTQTEFRAFTPAYASPEQIQGGAISVASDVYSLGVVLYELLTGSKPIDLADKSVDSIIQTFKGAEPSRPSSISSSGHGLRGDLDNIALTALRIEPERRYKTVDEFADDIDRYLTGRPVSARPNTRRYVVGKFVRRNMIAVAAAVMVLLSLITGLAVALWQADRATEERDRAQQRFQDVRQLSNSLLFEIAPRIERLAGSVDARELLVKRGLEYLDRLYSESPVFDQALMGELASAYEKIGELQGNVEKPNISDFAGAIESFEKARLIRGSLLADHENRLRLSHNLRMTSAIRFRQHDVTGSIADIEFARNILAELVAAAPNSNETRLAAVEALIEHGQIFSQNNRFSEAIPLFRSAVDDLKGMDQNSPEVQRLAAKSYSFLGNGLSWDGNQTDAEMAMAEALAITEKLASSHPHDPYIQASVWLTYTLASSIYEDSQDRLSLDLAKRALVTAQTSSDLDTADLQARYNVARAFSRVGIMQAKLNIFPDSISNLRRSEEILSQLIANEPKNMAYQRELGKLYVRLGDVSEKRNNYADALLKYQNSAVIFARLVDIDGMNTLAQRDLAQSLGSVGKLQMVLHQRDDARSTLQRAKAMLEHLRTNNALGGFDQKLVEDVDRRLASI